MSNLRVIIELAKSFTGALGGTSFGRSTSINRIASTNCKDTVSPTKFLNCLYTNATSLVNKWSDFNSLAAFLNSPHVILITETWFNALSNCKLDNYQLYCKNREMARGGGVAIYVRRDVESFEVSEAVLSNTRSEQVWCNVKTKDETVLVGCIYRPPNADGELDQVANKVEV